MARWLESPRRPPAVTGGRAGSRSDEPATVRCVDERTRTWYALLHRPGPAVEAGRSVFEHPGFADHVAFLQRLAAAGTLLLAGPLTDVDGDGMTVIVADSLPAAVALAESDDSVRAGVLSVTVRPWQVRMAPILG